MHIDHENKRVDLDLTNAADARYYIEHFQENVFKRRVDFVDLSSGRRVILAQMSDEDAVLIANEMREMEEEADRRSAEESKRRFGVH